MKAALNINAKPNYKFRVTIVGLNPIILTKVGEIPLEMGEIERVDGTGFTDGRLGKFDWDIECVSSQPSTKQFFDQWWKDSQDPSRRNPISSSRGASLDSIKTIVYERFRVYEDSQQLVDSYRLIRCLMKSYRPESEGDVDSTDESVMSATIIVNDVEILSI